MSSPIMISDSTSASGPASMYASLPIGRRWVTGKPSRVTPGRRFDAQPRLAAAFARFAPRMVADVLRPQLNQIRSWVRQGRTDAWIAHQLEVTVQQIEAFKRENELAARRRRPEGADGARLRRRDRPPRRGRRAHRRRARGRRRGRQGGRGGGRGRGGRRRRGGRARRRRASDEDEDGPQPRRRGRRGGRGRRRPARAGPSRARSTTARRATGSGSTRPSQTTPSTPSTGRVTAPSRSRSKRTRS